ncbi:MAG: MtnX-like HAD-IB family phosphatase [Dehalococcoidales bacterium]|nr:MtnX-like HAD-IB family phosphatase [Dehalococcoidales bacterium]
MIIQIDFDGTITEEDVSFVLLDTFAEGDWRKWFQQYRENKISVGDFNTKAFAMVKVGSEELLQVARDKVRLRDGLHNLVAYCQERGFRLVIVSNGLDFYIKSILENVGLGNIEAHAAQTRFNPGRLEVQYIGPEGNPLSSGFKEAYTKLFLKQGYRVVYVGNGPSDIFPASLAQHIFARDGLLDSCRERNLACKPFDDFNDVVRGLKLL